MHRYQGRRAPALRDPAGRRKRRGGGSAGTGRFQQNPHRSFTSRADAE